VHVLKNLITGFLSPITQILVTAIIKAVQSTTTRCLVGYMTLSSIRTNFIALRHRPKPKTKQDDDNYEKYAIMNGKWTGKAWEAKCKSHERNRNVSS